MNKKGFTIIELITAFTLASVIIYFLFNVVFILKDMYVENDTQSTLLVEQSILSQTINHDLFSKKVNEIKSCKDASKEICLEFHFDGESDVSKLEVVDTNSAKSVTYGNYIYPLSDAEDFEFEGVSYFDTRTQACLLSAGTKKVLYINIPIHSRNKEGQNFGIRMIYPIGGATSVSGVVNCS
jgi:hypothetical protein